MLVFGGAGYWYANQQQSPKQPPQDQVRITKPVAANGDVNNTEVQVPIDRTKDPIRQAIEAQLAAADGMSRKATTNVSSRAEHMILRRRFAVV